jgi:hypothetical protein
MCLHYSTGRIIVEWMKSTISYKSVDLKTNKLTMTITCTTSEYESYDILMVTTKLIMVDIQNDVRLERRVNRWHMNDNNSEWTQCNPI